MATFYWVGGSGTWDASSTANWAASSGGAGSAGVPTSADDVVFDSASNATDYTVTFGSVAVCANWTVAGPTSGSVTFAGTDGVFVHGSLLWPATGMVKSYTGTTTLAATTTGKTVTTNGLNAGNITFNGVGGGWALGGALTASVVTVTNGSFSTSVSNYAVTTVEFLSNNSNTRTVNFNGSTITCTRSGLTNAIDFADPTGLTFSAGTSQITLSGTNANFGGGGQVFHNASFTSASGTAMFLGANTFNNLTIAPRGTTGLKKVFFHDNQIVNGTLSCTTITGFRRTWFLSNVTGTQRTLKVAASSIRNVDFQDITIDPASATYPLTGTQLGNANGNSGITFAAGIDKYFVNAAGGDVGNSYWALSSGGAVGANGANFPLPQDTIIIDNNSSNSGTTINFSRDFWFGSLDCSARSTPVTLNLNTAAGSPFFNDITLDSDVTVANGGGKFYLQGYSTTQIITIGGATINAPIEVSTSAYDNEVLFADGFTSSSSVDLLSSTVVFLAGATYTASAFSFSNTTIESSTPGAQFTLSQASGTVSAANTTITDSNATGGASWDAFISNGNVDGGNNTGWDFLVQFGRYIYTRRKNKVILQS